MRVRLSVFFDGQFWVGVFERHDGQALSVARVVFGPEPTGPELLAFICSGYPSRVRFGPPAEDLGRQTPTNPKRAQREARRAMAVGPSKKAWEAMRLAQEATKQERKEVSRTEREADELRRFELRQQKRKKKHRGH